MNKTTIKRKTCFTSVSNALINDAELSWKAKGILIYMLSKPEGWNYNPKGDIVKRATDGQASLYGGLKELIEAGYISRIKHKSGAIDYYIFEDKNDNQITDYLANHENPDQENRDQGNPDQENRDVLVILNNTNTEINNIEISKPKKEKFDPENFKPDNVSEGIWSDFIKHRIEIKKRLTETSCKALKSKIEGMTDPEAAIELSITQGWQGVFEKDQKANVYAKRDIRDIPKVYKKNDGSLMRDAKTMPINNSVDLPF